MILSAILLATAAASTGSPSPQKSTASQKVIKDPAEYNAYIAALSTADPTQRAAAMEAFVQNYTDSVVQVDALEQEMAAYQQIGDTPKVEETANRILQAMPANVRALAIAVAIDRAKTDESDELCTLSQKGLQQLPSWQKPEALTDADFEKLKAQVEQVFDGAAGFCALQSKNYSRARDYLTAAFQIDPTDLQNTYQLAVAYLEMDPIDANGFWYCGKAMALARWQNNEQAVQSMEPYCRAKYKRYHGSDDGWERVLAASEHDSKPPSGAQWHAKAEPTACDLAVQAVKENDPASLSFSDWEFILERANCSPANKEAADVIWRTIQKLENNGEAKLKIPIKVISATKTTVDGAITEENQQANKPDVHIKLGRPVEKPPVPGATIAVIGVITSYTPDPFIFTIEKGELEASRAE